MSRRLLGVVGDLLVTAGVVVLLYVVHMLWGTGLATRGAQADLRDRAGPWATAPSTAPAVPPSPTTSPAAPPPGEPVTLLRIPRLGPDYAWVVVEGVRPADLAKGPGRYPDAALPGQVGNVAIAGHRATHGEPFALLDRLRQGDLITLDTPAGRYSYAVDSTEIVLPDDVDVIAPVPNDPGATPTQERLTLTTCHPRWGSTHRLIVFATRVV